MPADPHPLDPLTSDEITKAIEILKASPDFPRDGRFSSVALKEPSKDEVLAFKPGSPIRRQVFAVVLDRKGNRTFEAEVDLSAGRTASFTEIKNAQPFILEGEYEDLSRIVKTDPAWQEAIRKRGIDDVEKVQVDGWAVGQVDGSQGRPGQFLRASDRGRDRAGEYEHRQSHRSLRLRSRTAGSTQPGIR
jgi:primary-amine oxidase